MSFIKTCLSHILWNWKKKKKDKTIVIFQVYNFGLQQRPKTSKVIIPLSSAPFGELDYFVNYNFKVRPMN